MLVAFCCAAFSTRADAASVEYVLASESTIWSEGRLYPLSGSFTLQDKIRRGCINCDLAQMTITALRLSSPVGDFALPDSLYFGGFEVGDDTGDARFGSGYLPGQGSYFSAPLLHRELSRSATQLVFETTYLSLDGRGPNTWTLGSVFPYPADVSLRVALSVSSRRCDVVSLGGISCTALEDPERRASLRIDAYQVVPEPGSGALVASALLGLALVRRRSIRHLRRAPGGRP